LDDDTLLTFEEALVFLKISDKILIRALAKEKVPARKLGNKWRFSKQALVKWIGDGNSQDYTQADGETAE
jgi:excisionase family DNA binding protein